MVEAGAMRKLATQFECLELKDQAIFWHSMAAESGDPLSVKRIAELEAGSSASSSQH
jgi:hypothetical protein